MKITATEKSRPEIVEAKVWAAITAGQAVTINVHGFGDANLRVIRDRLPEGTTWRRVTPTQVRVERRTYRAVLGDWNAAPDNAAPFGPRWIANRTGMKIKAPAPGKHGRIDFGMSDADMSDARRVGGGGSDHGMVLYDFRNPDSGRELRGGTWNVERDRSGAERRTLVEFLRRELHQRRIDFLVLQEAQEYRVLLDGLPGYRLLGGGGPGPGQNVILVRQGVDVTDTSVRQMSPEGWRTPWGPMHKPMYSPFTTLDGWLRVAGAHETPGLTGWDGQGPNGGAPRVAARIASAWSWVKHMGRRG